MILIQYAYLLIITFSLTISSMLYGMGFDIKSVPVISEDEKGIVQGATYFKLHGKTRCLKHTIDLFTLWDPNRCPEYGLHKEYRLGENEEILTYHDRQWRPIALMKIVKLQPLTNNFYTYVRSRLDPDYKPKALQAALIKVERKKMLQFREVSGQLLCQRSYKGSAILSNHDYRKFSEELDLSELERIEDHTGSSLASFFSYCSIL